MADNVPCHCFFCADSGPAMSSFAVAAAIQKKLKITGVNRIDVLID
jgi:hypothetical protein